MLLLQLLQPVLTVFGGGEGWNAEEQVAGFTEELQTVLTKAYEQVGQTEGKVRDTANAVVENAGNGSGQATVGEVDTQTEESGGIRVEVGHIRLE